MQLIYLLSLLLALPCHSLVILVPLYLYPDTSASAWSNITAAIAANPQVDWQIIVNPNSGPGTSSPPDANYITAISKLNSFSNVLTVGYIATGYTQVPYTSLTTQIDLYAQWAEYNAANISVSGIFFDEASNTAANDVYEYYQQAADYVYSNIPSTVTPIVILNPGAPAPAQLFDHADTIVQYENAFSSYKDESTIDSFAPGFNEQTAIIVHSTPSTADINSLVDT
ncbi:MAG: hypothetical protein Q9183_004316, partial [Haloplaca sp. 2 TL-2023]